MNRFAMPRSFRVLSATGLGLALLVAGLPGQAADAAAPLPLTTAAPNADADKLLQALEQRLGSNPFDPVAMNNLAITRLADGQPYAAAELLERAVQLAPENPVIVANHGRINAWLDAEAEAEATRQRRLGKVPEPTDAPFPPDPPPIWTRR